MSERHSVIPRTLCFVFYENELLMLKASTTKEWDGTYNALGGHIEKGEGIIENALREIREEAGLDVVDTKLRGVIHVSNFYGKNVMMFVTSSQATNKEVQANHEGELEWVPIDQIDTLKVFGDIEPILNYVLKMKPEETFLGVSEFDGKAGLLNLDITVN